MNYRVIVQTLDKEKGKLEQLNEEVDTIDQALHILETYIPNVVRRRDIINIQILRQE